MFFSLYLHSEIVTWKAWSAAASQQIRRLCWSHKSSLNKHLTNVRKGTSQTGINLYVIIALRSYCHLQLHKCSPLIQCEMLLINYNIFRVTTVYTPLIIVCYYGRCLRMNYGITYQLSNNFNSFFKRLYIWNIFHLFWKWVVVLCMRDAFNWIKRSQNAWSDYKFIEWILSAFSFPSALYTASRELWTYFSLSHEGSSQPCSLLLEGCPLRYNGGIWGERCCCSSIEHYGNAFTQPRVLVAPRTSFSLCIHH